MKKNCKESTSGNTSSPKKETRRSRAAYPALDPALNLKSRTELIDYDYLDKLSDEEKAFLNKFTEEFINAGFNSKNPRKNLHRTKIQRQECYNRNNARNRDIFTKAKAMRSLTTLEAIEKADLERPNEDSLIDALDSKLTRE